MLEQIVFPIVAFGNDTAITVYQNHYELTKCFKRALTNGYFNDLKLYDSNGIGYKVIDAKKIGTIGGLWGYDFFLDQTIRVSLHFDSNMESLTIDQFKKLVEDKVNNARSVWLSEGISRLKKTIKESISFEDLIREISQFINKKNNI